MKTFFTIIALFTAGILNAAPLLQNEYMNVGQSGECLILTSGNGNKTITIDLPGQINEPHISSPTDALWGKGTRLTIEHDGSITDLTLYKGNPFSHLETRVINDGNNARDIKKLTIAHMELDLGIDPTKLNTLGSSGLRAYNQPKGSYAYSVLADSDTRNGIVCGWLTQHRGVGLMLPSFKEGKHLLETQLDFGLMRVQPNQTRETDILMLGFFDDARIGLENYADDIAKVYDINLPPKPNVYCTWYHRNLTGSGASTEKILAENAAFAREHLQPFGLDVMQIDDHWQGQEPAEKKNKGPIKTFINTTEHFPGGMAKTADNLVKEGFVPGIWYMPFAGDLYNPYFDHAIFAKNKTTGEPFEDDRWSGTTIDASSPKGEVFLRERFKRIQDWGYRYIKVDGLHIGTPSHNIYVNRSYDGKTFGDAEIHNKDMTFIEAYRKGLKILREETPGTFILGCSATQNMVSLAPVFGLIDAMRVGPDNDGAIRGNWKYTIRGADFAGNLWFLNNRVWYNDPDPFYVRTSNPLHKTQWMASWLAVSGAMNTTSMQYSELPPERLDIIKRTLPAHNLAARPVDILENKKPQIWKVSNDRVCVLGLLNWEEEKETVIDYPLERMGLDPVKSYVAYDFWADRYLGSISGKLTSTLKGGHCQVLALRETKKYPQLLSTSRHITQGLIDVVSEYWNPDNHVLGGSSQVVAGDSYEMRIVCPAGFQAVEATINDKKAMTTSFEVINGLLRVTIYPTITGLIKWEVRFQTTESTS